MKKVVRMLGLCALVALAFTACKKDDTQKVTFTANVAQPINDTRTQTSQFGAFLVWNDNDVINVFNADGEEMDFTAQSSTGLPGNATFTASTAEEIAFVKDLENANFPYTAFYPNATVNEETGKVNLVIPAEQVYYPQRNFAPELYPMVGWNNGTTQFDFVSNAGMLNVSFTKLDSLADVYVDELVLTTNNPVDDPDLLTGTMVYDKDGGNYQFVGEGNQVVLRTGTPRDLDYEQARDFTFVLPAGALHSGFTLQVKLNGEVLETYEAQPKPANVIEAQKFTTIAAVSLPKPLAPTK